MSKYPLEEILASFSDETLDLIFRNMGTIELADGCSLRCNFCGLEPRRGASTMMTFSQIEYLANRFASQLNKSRPGLYWATDPLDWQEGSRTYREVSKLFESVVGYRPFTSTSVPVGKEALALELLLEGRIDRVSISDMNFFRLERFLKSEFPELETRKFVVEGKLPDRKVVFADKPNKNGNKNWLYLVIKLQNKDHLFPNVVYTLDGRRDPTQFLRLGVRNVDNLSDRGLGCFHGALLRHSGIYNIKGVKPTHDYPQGVVYEKINPEMPIVWDLWRLPLEFPCILPNTNEFPLNRTMRLLNPDADTIYPIPATEAQPVLAYRGKYEMRFDHLALRALAYEKAAIAAGESTMRTLAEDFFTYLITNFGPPKLDYSNPYIERVNATLKDLEHMRQARPPIETWNFKILHHSFILA